MLKLKKNGILLLLIMMSNLHLAAQHFNTSFDDAIRFYELQQYPKAIQNFNQVLKNGFNSLPDKDKLSVLLKLAYSYKQNKEEITAERIYRQAFTSFPKLVGNDIKAHVSFAQVLANNGKYQEAQEYLKLSETIQNINAQTTSLPQNTANNPQKANKPLLNSTLYKIEYLDLNTSGPEFSPIYYKDGIVFCSGKESSTNLLNDKGSFLDLYYLSNLSKTQALSDVSTDKKRERKPSKSLGKDYYSRQTSNDSKTLNYFSGDEEEINEQSVITESFSKSLNSKFHEGPATFSSDFSTIIFTRNNSLGNKKGLSEDNISKLKLYISKNVNGNWEDAVELPFNSNEFSTAHPTLSKNGKILYFASDRPGGFGGMDIWSVDYTNGIWSTPKNLGRNINSKGTEAFPFVDEVGNLYFSSNGQGGEGDLDIFFAETHNGQSFSKPSNLGKPFNSPFDDFGIITDKNRQTGYFSSNRKLGEDDDIYRFSLEKSNSECREMTIIVFDSDTKIAITNALVNIYSGGKVIETKRTDLNGNIIFCTTQDTDYAIKIEKEGFVINTVGYSTKGEIDAESSKLEVPLVNIKQIKLELQISASKNGTSPANSKNPNPLNLKNKSILTGFIKSEIDKRPMEGVLVSFINVCDNTTQQIITDADGSYTFYMNEDCDYTIEVSKSGYSKNVNKIKKVKNGNSKVISQDLSLFKEGDLITMDNIYYDSGSSILRKDAMKELNKLALTLQKTPTMVIEIGSYTDSRGDAQDNLNLSTKRAQAAVDYIVNKGISRNRILAKGYGESEPVNSCTDGVSCTEIEHQQNRRTTVKIIKIKQD